MSASASKIIAGRDPVTVSAPSNIAFIKYWGTRSRELALPANPSISMTLDSCRTTTTARWLQGPGEHEIRLFGAGGRLERPRAGFERPALRHLETVRRHFDLEGRFVVSTRNSFPTAAGIASSASGFTALTLAAAAAAGAELGGEELSSLARRSGSGSAARSALGGYVEWPAGDGEEEAYSRALHPADHWTLNDLVVIVDAARKAVSSREGHERAPTSPHFATRLRELERRLATVRTAIEERDLGTLGPVLEEEAIELHLVAMSSRPPIFYWAPATLRVLEATRRLRDDGVEVYATIDAGPNVHLICEPAAADTVRTAMTEVAGVRRVLVDRTGEGPCFEAEHLPLGESVDG